MTPIEELRKVYEDQILTEQDRGVWHEGALLAVARYSASGKCASCGKELP